MILAGGRAAVLFIKHPTVIFVFRQWSTPFVTFERHPGTYKTAESVTPHQELKITRLTPQTEKRTWQRTHWEPTRSEHTELTVVGDGGAKEGLASKTDTAALAKVSSCGFDCKSKKVFYGNTMVVMSSHICRFVNTPNTSIPQSVPMSLLRQLTRTLPARTTAQILCVSSTQKLTYPACIRVSFSTQTPLQMARDADPTAGLPKMYKNDWHRKIKGALISSASSCNIRISASCLETTLLPSLPILRLQVQLRTNAIRKSELTTSNLAFERNQFFQFTGNCVIQFTSNNEAKQFVSQSMEKLVGGNQIRFEFIEPNDLKEQGHQFMDKFRPPHMRSASGRAVILSGLPTNTEAAHLRDYLKLRHIYAVDSSDEGLVALPTSPYAITKKFLLKLPTENDAYRVARKLNNHFFRQNTFDTLYKVMASVAY
ncbi:hypothetical protein BC936DRAFT_146313 [Jimgerdemannia flammicorona]|uniref:Uncharacterized protein n=1 Tax=Jimgerdemannia flammicorona TaxID=994334 RepID=A0A433D7X0_9FUNG|nr:hypothetical protein BC936DRAFT_146313 [Jimgerdemannia flammicorona]